MKKNFFYLSLIAFLAVSCTDDLPVSNDSGQLSKENVEATLNSDDQSDALAAFHDLNDHYGFKTKSSQDQPVVNYPDYYGGCYLDGNMLVVYIKEGTENLPSVLTENSHIILKEGKYSYTYLYDVAEAMSDIYISDNFKLNPVSANLEMFGFSRRNNRIEVYLKDCSEAAISEFKQYMVDSPALYFIQAEVEPEEFTNFMERMNSISPRATYTVNPGSQIGAAPDMYSNQTPGSLGFKATYNKKNGFVTASHVAQLNDIVFTIYDINKANPIAKCTLSKKEGKVDIAFCEVTVDNCNTTNNINGNTSKVLSQKIFPAADILPGLKVSLAGYQTQSSGEILLVSYLTMIVFEKKRTGVSADLQDVPCHLTR